MIGEAGSKYGHDGLASDKAKQDALVTYLKARVMNSLFYWSGNPNSGDTGGICRMTGNRCGRTSWHCCSGCGIRARRRRPPAPPLPGGISTTLKISSDWGSGYCADVAVNNAGTVAVQWNVQLTIQGTMNNVWNAMASQSGTTLSAPAAPALPLPG